MTAGRWRLSSRAAGLSANVRHVLSVLFGAAFTLATAWALGRLLFSRLRIELRPAEARVLETITGASLLSLVVFLLCSIHLARTEVFAVLGAAVIYLGYRAKSTFQPSPPAP